MKTIMKRFILIILFHLCVISIFSQIADTEFGNSKNDVLDKLENRFGLPDSQDDTHITYWDKSYADHVWGYINFDFKVDTQDNSRLNYICLTKDFVYLESAKKFLYNLRKELPYTFYEAQKEVNILNSFEANDNGVKICLYIYYNKFAKEKYTVWLSYEDINIKYKEQDLNGSILYTTFGETYDKTESNLNEHFGEATYSDREAISYADITYDGINWHIATLFFTYTSSANYLSGIMLSKKCNNANEAKELRNYICYHKFSNYNFGKYKIENNGFMSLLSDGSDKYIIVRISKNKYNSPYVVDVIIKSELYNSNDKL